MNFSLNPWREPSPLQMAVRQLELAQRSRLTHVADMEYHMAMSAMLGQRVDRLQGEVQKLTAAEAKKDEAWKAILWNEKGEQVAP